MGNNVQRPGLPEGHEPATGSGEELVAPGIHLVYGRLDVNKTLLSVTDMTPVAADVVKSQALAEVECARFTHDAEAFDGLPSARPGPEFPPTVHRSRPRTIIAPLTDQPRPPAHSGTAQNG